jgi:hypothetical protein
MNAPFITTTVYKYNPYAPWILGVYCILLFVLFIFSPSLPSLIVGITAVVLLLLPVYAAIRRRSFFSIRSVDDRRLSIDAENIYWDGLTIPVQDVTGLNIYLYAFEDFKHRETSLARTATEFGDQNKLSFKFQDTEYDFTFYIADHIQYRTLLQIINAWQNAGHDVLARTAFEYSYIQEQIAHYSRIR